MKKTCPICQQPVKTDDIVVVLMLAKFKEQENSYGLQCMSQTISSHLYCVEKRKEPVFLDKDGNIEESK